MEILLAMIVRCSPPVLDENVRHEDAFSWDARERCLCEVQYPLSYGECLPFAQADINSFSKLNTKFHELEDDLKVKKVAIQWKSMISSPMNLLPRFADMNLAFSVCQNARKIVVCICTSSSSGCS